MLGGILAAAALLRLWALGSQPGWLFPDEAAEALDAHRLLHEPGFHPVFFQDDAGREALYGYLVAVAFRVAGESVTVLRGTSALIGLAGVALFYPWLRREGTVVALGATAWAAGSLWLVCVSRDGMRNILVLPASVVALWALQRWAVRPSRTAALAAGAAMGLGLWTYQPLKLLPVLTAAWLAWHWRRRTDCWPGLRAGLPWAILAYVVVGAPMLVTALLLPGLYFGRAVGVAAAGGGAGIGGMFDHVARTLLMFAVTGDPNERHNVASTPLLGWPLTLVAALGVAVAWRRRERPLESLLLLAVPVMLIPPLAGFADAAPHFLRSLGLAAPVGALVGMGCDELAGMARRLGRPRLAPITGVLPAVVLAGAGALTANAYFQRPEAPRYEAYSGDVVQLAAAARSAPPGTVVLIDPYRALDVLFLDSEALARPDGPLLLDPSEGAQPDRGAGCSALGRDRADIARVYGPAAAAGARPIAWNPGGRPSVWAAACH